jgi:acyl-coenzyme A synthetase/AMP-(fatty) acid ligase
MIEPNAREVKNIVERVFNHARLNPKQTALIFESGSKLNFEELLTKIQDLRNQLAKNGLKKGDRVLVLLPMSPRFIFLIFALFADNIVPVLIDPRLEKSYWRRYIAEAKTKAVISNRKILHLRWFCWWLFRYPLFSIDSQTIGCTQLQTSIEPDPENLEFQELPATDDLTEVLVSLTSGTTGNPKIVSRAFGIFKHQQKLSCKYLPPLELDIHLPLYGIAMLQSIVQGATTVIADSHSPQNLLDLIKRYKVTRFSGPPGIIDSLLSYMEQNKIKIENVQHVLSGGAPVPRWFAKKVRNHFVDSQFFIIYGSTECEPIGIKLVTKASLDSEDFGYNVGKPIEEIELLRTPFSNSYNHKIFEVKIKAPNCVIPDGESHLSIGDLAYENSSGDLILVGRKSEIKNGQISGYIEECLENLDFVKRAAIKWDADSNLLVFIEPHEQNFAHDKLVSEVQKRVQAILLDFRPTEIKVLSIKKIPVDPRHGWKIQKHLL